MRRHALGAGVIENVYTTPLVVSAATSKSRTRGNPCGPGCWPVKGGGCDCGGQVMRALKGALGGISGGPRGKRVSMWAMGDPALYTAATKCSEIPSGDPYRAPGNFCTGNDGSQKGFDAQGNAISTGPDLMTLGLYAAGALVAYKVLFKKKR